MFYHIVELIIFDTLSICDIFFCKDTLFLQYGKT